MGKGRHEIKHYISLSDYYVLKSRLSAVMELDSHVDKATGQYQIRSLYFDDLNDTCLNKGAKKSPKL